MSSIYAEAAERLTCKLVLCSAGILDPDVCARNVQSGDSNLACSELNGAAPSHYRMLTINRGGRFCVEQGGFGAKLRHCASDRRVLVGWRPPDCGRVA
jgi:hypothetical protein